MIADEPFNVSLLDVNHFIKNNFVKQITSLSIYEPSSTIFEETGLFSETIFGPLGSTERLVTFGYINLNTQILQPLIYNNVVKLASLYEELIEGASYAYFDPVSKNFVRCDPHHPEASTGFTFFMGRFHEIEFERNESQIRSSRIDILEKFKDILFCNKFLVLPAGLRDLEESQGAVTTDDINKLYQTLLSYSFSLPPNAVSTIYDGVRLAIQKKVVEIYDYIENILVGKRGFIQGVWGHRRVALGTRNVITTATYATMTPNDPQTIQPDETKIGLFQTMKAIQPVAVHYVRTAFITPIFGNDANLVPLIDPTTYELAYRSLSNDELARFQSPEAIGDAISKFQNIDIRNNPITITDEEGHQFYLLLVYDDGDKISLFRSLEEFTRVKNVRPKAVIIKGNPKYIDRPSIKPLADHFYNEIKIILESKGYEVIFDSGSDYTVPDETAVVWIGHSRGIDRLRFAKSNIKTIELQTQDSTRTFTNNDEQGNDPSHYQLSSSDKTKLSELTSAPILSIDRTKIHPLTWAEMFYMATYDASKGKHVFMTRYPVIQDESCYPTAIHLCSTIPSRVVDLVDANYGHVLITYPEYPILGRPYLDSMQIASSRLKGLDADFDGDTMSANAIMSDEANAEVHDFLNSIQSVVNAQRELLIGAKDDLVNYTIRALSIE